MNQPYRHPLLWLMVLSGSIMATLMILSDATIKRHIDIPMLVIISTAYLLACLSILTRTRWPMWTMLGAGLLATMLGDAVLYSYILSGRIWPAWTASHMHGITSFLRALLIVGGVFVVVGLSREWVDDQETGMLSPKRWLRRRTGLEDAGPAEMTTFSEDVAETIDQTAENVAEVKDRVIAIERKMED